MKNKKKIQDFYFLGPPIRKIEAAFYLTNI